MVILLAGDLLLNCIALHLMRVKSTQLDDLAGSPSLCALSQSVSDARFLFISSWEEKAHYYELR